MTKIKICGLKREEDIDYANILELDYIGFVFANSKRQVTRGQASILKQRLHSSIKAVGVFVNENRDSVVELLNDGIIDMAQLHGDESEEDILYIKENTNKKVIKAMQIGEYENPGARIADVDTAADYILIDSGKGSGKTFDWEILKDLGRPYFLAGGIGIDNVEKAIDMLNPYGIDLSSKVETEGFKDFQKMKAIVEAIRKGKDI